MRKGLVVWLFGLPCSGKTTLAKRIAEDLGDFVHLDGDDIRKGLSSDLGFSQVSREENLRRVSHVAKILSDNGINVVCSFITPLENQRRVIERIVGNKLFWVYVDAPLPVCQKRDVKGLYEKAKKGEIEEFTGFTSAFEPPTNVDVVVDTSERSVDECVMDIYEELNKKRARVFYIGRWQPFHTGHRYIIQDALNKGKSVLIGIRDMLPSKDNPFPARVVKSVIDDWYKGEDVETIILPNISAVAYGRKVGYDVYEVEVPPEIAKISGTELRKQNKHFIG